MTDRELLELAAKAAAIAITDWRVRLEDVSPVMAHESGCGYRFWNPLTDDGDALRLGVKVGLMVDVRYQDSPTMRVHNKVCFWLKDGNPYGAVDFGAHTDSLDATRRAIVRAAAAIGKAMP